MVMERARTQYLPSEDGGPRSPLRIMVDWTNEPTRMVLEGELDYSTVGLLNERASEVVGKLQGNLVLDIDRLTFVDASALSTFITLHKRLNAQGTKLVISSPSRMARRLFELTRLDHVLWIEPSRRSSVDAYGRLGKVGESSAGGCCSDPAIAGLERRVKPE